MNRIAVTPKYVSLAKLDGQGLGVCTNASDRGWRWFGRIAGSDGSKELQKLLPRSDRESVGGVTDDIGMHMFCEVEADGESARSCVRIIVRDQRNARRVGEAHCHRCGITGNM